MISKAKLALIAAVAAVSVVSPALAQAGVHHARRNALHAYAMEPQHAGLRSIHMRWSRARNRISIPTARQLGVVAASAITNY